MTKDFKILFLNKKNRKLFEDKWNEFTETSGASFESSLTFLDSMELDGLNNKSILVVDKNNELKGIFPLMEEKFLFLKRYKSLGFTGKLNFKKLLPSIRKKLGTLAIYIQINEEQKNKKIENKMLAYHFILDLKGKTEESVWKNDLNKKSRNLVRKAEKSRLKINISDSREELKKFYLIYVKRMKYFGTTPHSFRYMDYLKNNFPGFFILNVYLGSKIIAGGTVYIYNQKMFNQFATSDDKYLKYSPNNFFYWNMIKFALEKNCNEIDYGPSLIDDPVAKFKISMGGKPILFEDNLILNKTLYWIFKKMHKSILKLKKIIP